MKKAFKNIKIKFARKTVFVILIALYLLCFFFAPVMNMQYRPDDGSGYNRSYTLFALLIGNTFHYSKGAVIAYSNPLILIIPVMFITALVLGFYNTKGLKRLLAILLLLLLGISTMRIAFLGDRINTGYDPNQGSSARNSYSWLVLLHYIIYFITLFIVATVSNDAKDYGLGNRSDDQEKAYEKDCRHPVT